MDARYMNIFDNGGEIVAASVSELDLPADKKEMMSQLIEQMYTCDKWDPEYQAYSNLIRTYLQSGNAQDLAGKYLAGYALKALSFTPINNVCGDIFGEVLHLGNVTSSEAMVGVTFNEVVEILPKCQFITERFKLIRKYQRDANEIRALFKQLLNGTWTEVMSAMYLYWSHNCQSHYWSDEETKFLKDRIEDWKQKYFSTYREIISWAPASYAWYKDNVFAAMKKLWDNAFGDASTRWSALSANVVYNLTPQQSELFVDYSRRMPQVYEEAVTPRMAWDAVCYQIYPQDATAHMSSLFNLQRKGTKCVIDPGAEKYLGASNNIYFYCISSSTMNTLYDKCSWFYNLVMSGELVPLLTIIKRQELAASEVSEGNILIDDAVQEYVMDLVGRGFQSPDDTRSSEEYTIEVYNSMRESSSG